MSLNDINKLLQYWGTFGERFIYNKEVNLFYANHNLNKDFVHDYLAGINTVLKIDKGVESLSHPGLFGAP